MPMQTVSSYKNIINNVTECIKMVQNSQTQQIKYSNCLN